MGTISRGAKAGGGTNYNSGQVIDPAEVNTDENTLFAEINGNLDDANIETATIPGSKSLRFTEISDPSTPSSNDILLFGTDGTGTKSFLKTKDASGRTCQLGRTFLPGLTGGTASPIAGVLVGLVGSVSTGANTTETDTISYTMPANTLNVAGDAIEFIALCRTAANGNNKRFRAYLGSTAVFDTTASAWNNQMIYVSVLVRRISSTSQTITSIYHRGTAVAESAPQFFPNVITAAEDLTTDLALRFTALNGTATASDCTVNEVQVRIYPST